MAKDIKSIIEELKNNLEERLNELDNEESSVDDVNDDDDSQTETINGIANVQISLLKGTGKSGK
ncbi:MAG: hypothetical protein LBD17_04090 [Endomicrobium sp.]|jgi:sugar-specific transcriptional regulator TrmB|nr:hypothetical protein [Endomicrobium sp.]